MSLTSESASDTLLYYYSNPARGDGGRFLRVRGCAVLLLWSRCVVLRVPSYFFFSLLVF